MYYFKPRPTRHFLTLFLAHEFAFPESSFDEEYHNKCTEFSRSNNINYFISSCFFLRLRPNGAIRINSTIDDVKTYTTTNKFDSCSSGSQSGGSLYFESKGEFIQTKNSFIKSTNSNAGTSFSIQVSNKPNYKNHANETLVSNCGSSEQDCLLTTFMAYGFIIMNECNITQNRVKKHNGGYRTTSITSDSYITCVNVIENNQTSGEFNWHSSSESYISSIFKITSCNYIRNKSPNNGSLIFSWDSSISMNYCCIRENEISCIFYSYCSIIFFTNSTTDNTTYYEPVGSPIFENTDISFENECPLLNLDFMESIPVLLNNRRPSSFVKLSYFKRTFFS